MERWLGKIAVVTGASSGIGAAIVIELANKGITVIGLARRVERIEELKFKLLPVSKDLLFAKKCDVSNNEEVKSTFNSIIQQFGGIDILINNAGIITRGNLVDSDKTDDFINVVNTNILAPIFCIREAFNSMKDRNVAGHIIIINSVLGHKIPAHLPFSLNIYPSTKYAVTAMNEVLRREFQRLHSKVKITSLSPGLVDTEMIGDNVKDAFNDIEILLPEDIASAITYILATPPRLQIHELTITPSQEPI